MHVCHNRRGESPRSGVAAGAGAQGWDNGRVTALIISLLAVCIVALLVVQGVWRHRHLQQRANQGQVGLPRSAWIMFGVAAAFLLFAVFVFPALLKR